MRLARRLPSYLRERDTVEDGRRVLAEQLANRESNFLTTVERCIYAHARSPYLPLLKRAGCEMGDVRALVADRGLEGALLELRREGVYIRFEESKGREPIRRGDLEYEVDPAEFGNPYSFAHLHSTTSGSTGKRTRNPVDLDYQAQQSPIRMLIYHTQGLLDGPVASVRPGLPESSLFGDCLRNVRWGRLPERWFVPVLDPPRKPALRFRMATRFVTGMARVCGTPFPRQEPVRMRELDRVVRWAEEALARGGGCKLRCTPSMALRIALVAQEIDVDLTGTVFQVGGEPMTEGKMRGITASGATAVVDYAMSGMAGVGAGCLNPRGVNDQHLFTHHLGVVQSARDVGGVEVGALLFTALNPNAPRVFLNVESDDYGELEECSCGCPLEELGLRTHVRDVRSFKKLTAEGVTLVGSEMEHVLDTVLPERFGGSALDYQLAEEEDEKGFTRICVNVSPTVELDDERALVEAVLEGLSKASVSADLAVRLWNEADAIQVRRVHPVLGGRGKLQPLHLRGSTRLTQ